MRSQGAGPAVETVSAGYGAFHVFATLNLAVPAVFAVPAVPAVLAGWVVLALGDPPPDRGVPPLPRAARPPSRSLSGSPTGSSRYSG
ncbi:hypothetical protein [Streptomyces sp. DSM 118878]